MPLPFIRDKEMKDYREPPSIRGLLRQLADAQARIKVLEEALRHLAGEVETDGACMGPCWQDAADIAREALGMPSVDEAIAALAAPKGDK